jgi:hypothetical protein
MQLSYSGQYPSSYLLFKPQLDRFVRTSQETLIKEINENQMCFFLIVPNFTVIQNGVNPFALSSVWIQPWIIVSLPRVMSQNGRLQWIQANIHVVRLQNAVSLWGKCFYDLWLVPDHRETATLVCIFERNVNLMTVSKSNIIVFTFVLYDSGHWNTRRIKII